MSLIKSARSGRIIVETASSPIGPPNQVAILNPECGGALKLITTPDNQVAVRQVGINVDIQFSSPIGRVVTITSITNNPNGGYNISGNGPPGLTIHLRNKTLTIPANGQFNLIGVTLPTGLTHITNPSGEVTGTIYMKETASEVTTIRSSTNEAYVVGIGHWWVGDDPIAGYANPMYDPIVINGESSFSRSGSMFFLYTDSLYGGQPNYIKDVDGNNLGSFWVVEGLTSVSLVTAIAINYYSDGTLSVDGFAPDEDRVYINGQSGDTNRTYGGGYEGFFSFITTVHEGANYIKDENNKKTIGQFNVKDGNLVP